MRERKEIMRAVERRFETVLMQTNTIQSNADRNSERIS